MAHLMILDDGPDWGVGARARWTVTLEATGLLAIRCNFGRGPDQGTGSCGGRMRMMRGRGAAGIMKTV